MEAKSTSSIPESTIDWLQSSQTPSIRYLTLIHLRGKSADNSEVLSARNAVLKSKPVQAIFAHQKPEGFWNTYKHYYSPKYRSSHWTMYLLTELAVPREHPQLQLGAEHMLRRMENEELFYGGNQSTGFSCFWGNWLRYELYSGNFEHPKVQSVIDHVCADIHRLCRCRYNYDKPCAWGVVRALNGLAAIQINERPSVVKSAIKKGIAFLVDENDLTKADYPYEENVNELWTKLSFPLFYHTDILFVLRVLNELEALHHPGVQSALHWLLDKHGKNGIWRGGSPFRKRTRPFLVEPDSPSHWVTLHSAIILNAARM